MKNYLNLCLLLFITAYTCLVSVPGAQAQSKFFFGMNTGAGIVLDNTLAASVPAGTALKDKTDWAFRVRVGTSITEKSRVRLDLGAITMDTEVRYTYTAPQPDPVLPAASDLTVNAVMLDINYDYRLIGTEKVEVFAAAGIRSQLGGRYTETTTFGDGREEDTFFITRDHKRNLTGVGVGMVAKYNLSEKAGFVFSPDYSHYFGGLNERSTSNLKRLNLLFGVEYRL